MSKYYESELCCSYSIIIIIIIQMNLKHAASLDSRHDPIHPVSYVTWFRTVTNGFPSKYVMY